MNLYTLFVVGLCTLAVASTIMFWETRFNPGRRGALTCWAAGYLSMAVGCGLLLLRHDGPRLLAYGVSNLFIVAGYALLLVGVLPFVGLRLPAWTWRVAVPLSAVWLVVGPVLSVPAWTAVSNLPVAMLCFALSGVLMTRGAAGGGRAGMLAAALFGFHGLMYALRIMVIPLLYLRGDADHLQTIALWTMLEGILFSMAAPMALLSLTREESQNQLLQASQTDFLTGLYNRRAFFAKTEPLVATGKAESSQPASLVVFDLDHFKQINDLHGHETGDDVLRIFARVAAAELQPGDIIARLGGEEFAALLPGRGSDDARVLLQSIARRFGQQIRAETPVTAGVTFSAGLVETRGGRPMADLLGEADRLLYRAKHLGRNRVESDSEAVLHPVRTMKDEDTVFMPRRKQERCA